MLTVNIHEAKTNLSKLIQMAVDGQPFVIANRGKPMVMVEAYEAPAAEPKRRIGSLKGQISVPDDIKTMFKEEIEEMFYGSSTDLEAKEGQNGSGRS